MAELTFMQAMMAASTAMNVVGALQGGEDKSRQYQAAANAAKYNADLARNKAENARAVSGQQEESQRRAARFVIGKQRAAGAQAGTGMGGSTADVEGQSALMAEMDSLNIRYKGSLEAQGYLAQADMNDYESAGYTSSASSSKSGSYLTAAAAALSGAASYGKLTAPAASDRPKLTG